MATSAEMTARQPPAALERLTTGTAPGDQILGGGFPVNTINIVMGQPGTGKTIFVEQLLFANAGGERPVLYLTTLSEPLAKVVRFVQGFDFFDADKLGTAVVYDDIGGVLAEEGVSALVPWLKSAIREMKPALIVIDSFRALHDLSDSSVEIRRLIHDLTGLLTAYDTTAFLIGEYHQDDIRRFPEFAVADSVVELSRRPLRNRDDRFFRVLKLRGSPYQEGSHAFRITRGGIELYPRLVSPQNPVGYALETGRVSTGVAGLDRMLDGGLRAGSATLLAGPSGSGKTTLSLQFLLEGLRRGERSLCVNFQENPTQLARTVRRLAGDDVDTGALETLYASPVELRIDTIVVELFRRIESRGIRRLALDGIGDLHTSGTDSERVSEYLYALMQHLAIRGITSIFTLETGAGSGAGPSHPGPISYLADNLLALDGAGEAVTRRTIRVIKTRDSAHDPAARELVFGRAGIALAPADAP
jgi:circadian clock protein KaiC